METLVAIAILLLVIVGPMTIAQKGIQNAYYANEQIAATFYAQEAIEAVRDYRDNVALDAYQDYETDAVSEVETDEWMDEVPFCGFDTDCTVAYNSTSKAFVTPSTENNKIAGATHFTRVITLEPRGNGNVEVKVEVSWQSQVLGARDVVLQTWIYNHYQRYGN